MNEFLLWWSIISTVLGLFFLAADIYLFVTSKKEAENKKDQVKIWHVTSNGVTQALYKICFDADHKLYSSVKDIKNAVWAVQTNASSLSQSLYEERVVDEKEYKEEQKVIRENINKQAEKDFLTSNFSTKQEPKK